MNILEIIFLVGVVTSWALWNDRDGDDHRGLNDVAWECFFIVTCSAIITIVEFGIHQSLESAIFYIKCLCVSFFGFALFFPYLFNWHWHNKLHDTGRLEYILNHLSEKAIPDKWFLKYNVSWMVRLFIYCALFSLSILWFLNN